MYQTSVQSPSLYIGDLAEDVSEQTLHEVFSNIGAVASIRVCRDHSTRQSLGYAYVNFHNANDADRAIQTLNFTDINGKQCRIMWSQRDPVLRKSGLGNIFIKNLDPSVDNKSLMDTFSVFGNILSCKVATDSEGRSKGYGYVHFDTIEAAKKAIDAYDNNSGQPIRVSLFQRREERERSLEWTNVYIKNIPQEWDEDKLEEIFSEFGTRTSTKISRDVDSSINPGYAHRGFGFVNFALHSSAKQAVDTFYNKPYKVSPGLYLFVARFKSKFERLKEKDKNYATRKIEKMQRYNGVNLYIKNIDDEINEDILRDLFAKFGNVTSTRIMRDPSGYSKGFGFVSFSNVEEAREAMSEMNNCTIFGKPVKVYLAMSREQRRAQQQAMSQQMYNRPTIPYSQPMFPMYMQPNQTIPNSPRPFSMMPMMPRQPIQRSQAPYRGYPMPPYGVNQFPQPGSAHQGNHLQHHHQQQQQQQQHHQQQQQQQSIARKFRTVKPGINNNRYPRSSQYGSNRLNPNEQSYPLPVIPLAPQMLSSVTLEQQKFLIGERLFTRISSKYPDQAPKITGMLLEMESTELLHLLETDTALDEKVQEAIEVLKNYEMHRADS